MMAADHNLLNIFHIALWHHAINWQSCLEKPNLGQWNHAVRIEWFCWAPLRSYCNTCLQANPLRLVEALEKLVLITMQKGRLPPDLESTMEIQWVQALLRSGRGCCTKTLILWPAQVITSWKRFQRCVLISCTSFPEKWAFGFAKRWHSCGLSPLVEKAFHALAMDQRREQHFSCPMKRKIFGLDV